MAKIYVKRVKEEYGYSCVGCYFNRNDGCAAPTDSRFRYKDKRRICFTERIIYKKIVKKNSKDNIFVDLQFTNSKSFLEHLKALHNYSLFREKDNG